MWLIGQIIWVRLDIVVISLPDNDNIIMHFQALLSKLVSCTSLWSQYLSLWYCNSRLTLMGSSEKCSQSKSAFFTSLNWLPGFSISNLSSQGSVVVFGAYSTWTYEEAVDETFCDYTCFMFAFVLLILRWVKRDTPVSTKPPDYLFFPGHNALRHLLWLHEADVQRLHQRPPGQLRWKFWNPILFSSKKRTFKIIHERCCWNCELTHCN